MTAHPRWPQADPVAGLGSLTHTFKIRSESCFKVWGRSFRMGLSNVIGDNDWKKYVAREASLLLQQLNPTDTYNIKLAQELVQLREETRGLRAVNANFKWEVEQTAPSRPTTSASARAARTMSTPPARARRAHAQQAADAPPPAGCTTQKEAASAPSGAEAATARGRGDGTSSRSRRAAPTSAQPSIASSVVSSRSDPPSARPAVAHTEPSLRRAALASRGQGHWAAGDEPRGTFYAARPYTETRPPAPGDEDCDVDALRKRTPDFGGLGTAAREANALDAAAAAAARSRRGFRPAAAPAPGATLLAAHVSAASLGRASSGLHGRTAARTAGAARGELVRAAADAVGVWAGVAVSLGTAGLASGLHTAEAARPRTLAPGHSSSAAVLVERNLGHRQVKYADFDATVPRRAPGLEGPSLAAMGARSETLRAAEADNAAASARAAAERKAATAAARAKGDAPLGATTRIAGAPLPDASISAARDAQRLRCALATAEAAKLLAEACPSPRRGGRETTRRGPADRASGAHRRSAAPDVTPALMVSARLDLERMRLGWPVGEA
jgi:hypothetical protein